MGGRACGRTHRRVRAGCRIPDCRRYEDGRRKGGMADRLRVPQGLHHRLDADPGRSRGGRSLRRRACARIGDAEWHDAVRRGGGPDVLYQRYVADPGDGSACARCQSAAVPGHRPQDPGARSAAGPAGNHCRRQTLHAARRGQQRNASRAQGADLRPPPGNHPVAIDPGRQIPGHLVAEADDQRGIQRGAANL
ncbi:hypothetical protein LMG31886_05310 [Xanthomonas hydrangeae]|nr:hypothetical protein LMG31884_05350 [Xanthomonas hydrangeae]CAD7713296.1 hypothetical protein LMG31884_05350 [Xanthomonas hydrangeae]CAD7719246.1 hypothetical protein LMG31887_05350 [Xanthomonas hydrangeae]CAD7719249.1 hypothetical protein LMG31887_05350 [Xanthomonas hydrangeae]CAD7723506.1 hypothetical protein LMG31886_05310 [Xanthomonas hydrangeae]